MAWITAWIRIGGEEEGGAALGATGLVSGVVGEGRVAVEALIAIRADAVKAVLETDGASFRGCQVVVLLAFGAIVGSVSRDAVRIHRGAPHARLKSLPGLAGERASAGWA